MTIPDALQRSIEHGTVEGFAAFTLAAGGAVMDVPLLHPWANRLARDELVVHGRRVRLPGPPLVRRDEHGLPIHGMLGAHPAWSVHEGDADGHAARLVARFDFAGDPRLVAAFPFPHELVVEATLSPRSLSIATTVLATGGVAVPIAAGRAVRLLRADDRPDERAVQRRRPPRGPARPCVHGGVSIAVET